MNSENTTVWNDSFSFDLWFGLMFQLFTTSNYRQFNSLRLVITASSNYEDRVKQKIMQKGDTIWRDRLEYSTPNGSFTLPDSDSDSDSEGFPLATIVMYWMFTLHRSRLRLRSQSLWLHWESESESESGNVKEPPHCNQMHPNLFYEPTLKSEERPHY